MMFFRSREQKELIERCRLLDRIQLNDSTSDADKEWNQNRITIRNNIMKQNISKFLSWDVIKKTMFVGNTE